MITTCIPTSGKTYFLERALGDQFMLALYTSQADLGPDTTAYTSANEVRGKGYKPGGLALKNPRVWVDRGAACLTFDSVAIQVATLTARGFLVYNKSRDNRAIFVGDWGGEYTSTEGPFTIPIAADLIVFD
jgi:hypothetical protein